MEDGISHSIPPTWRVAGNSQTREQSQAQRRVVQIGVVMRKAGME